MENPEIKLEYENSLSNHLSKELELYIVNLLVEKFKTYKIRKYYRKNVMIPFDH